MRARLLLGFPPLAMLAGCQLTYEVSLCREASELFVQIELDGDPVTNIRTISIYELESVNQQANDPADWTGRPIDPAHNPIDRVPFGRSTPRVPSDSPSLAYDPAKAYSVSVDGEWSGWTRVAPGETIDACD